MFHKVGGQIENWGRFSCRHTGRQRKGKERKDPGISTFGLSRKFSDPICSRHDLCRATFVARQVFNFSQLNKNPFSSFIWHFNNFVLAALPNKKTVRKRESEHALHFTINPLLQGAPSFRFWSAVERNWQPNILRFEKGVLPSFSTDCSCFFPRRKIINWTIQN